MKSRKYRFLFLGIPIAFSLARCAAADAAPDKITGAIFTENYVSQGLPRPPVPIVERPMTRSFLLNPDSTFLLVYGSYPVSVGRWSYQKLGPMSGKLVLDGYDQRLSIYDRSLEFTGSRSGMFTDLVPFTVGKSFQLRPFSDRSRVGNISSRFFVRTGDSAIAGFVVGGEETDGTIVLIRAIGPGLLQFGISDPLRTPKLTVLGAGRGEIAQSEGWSSENAESVSKISQTSTAAGAFPLAQSSRDAAVVLTLAPGAYTAIASSSDPTQSGQVLIEVYVLP